MSQIPATTPKKSSGTDFLAFQKVQKTPDTLKSTLGALGSAGGGRQGRGQRSGQSPAASSGSSTFSGSGPGSGSGTGFFNKLLKRLTTRTARSNSASTGATPTSSSGSGVASKRSPSINRLSSATSAQTSKPSTNAHSQSTTGNSASTIFTEGLLIETNVRLPQLNVSSPSTIANIGRVGSVSGTTTPEKRLRKNSLKGRSRSRSIGNSEHDIFDDGNSSMYDDDDNSSTATSSVSSASSLASKSSLTYMDEQIDGVRQHNNNTFDILGQLNGNHNIMHQQWSGLTLQSLHKPKYIKASRKKKLAPKILSSMFLAQELCGKDEPSGSTLNVPVTATDSDSLISHGSGDEAQYWSNSSMDHDSFSENHAASSEPMAYENSPSLNGLKENLLPKDQSSKNEIFVMEFSRDGKYLATAGKDSKIRIWKVITSPLARLEYVSYERSRATSNTLRASISSNTNATVVNPNEASSSTGEHSPSIDKGAFPYAPVFHQKPIRVFQGHTHNVISLDWSKNNFIVSGSMDRTCKLWHVDRPDCLDTFQHEDFVTSVSFHPTDDRFFLSGSLDNRLRLWSILEKNIAYSIDLGENVLITAVNFTPDGLICFAGGFNGSLFTLETKGLHIINRYEIKEKHLVNYHNKNGNKITGIKVFEDLNNSINDDDEDDEAEAENENAIKKPQTQKPIDGRKKELAKWNVLVTTNDSKIRLVNSHQKKLVTRFLGLVNNSSSIVASVSDDNKYIISGSEDHHVYVWENNNSIINNKLKNQITELLVEGKHQILDFHNKHKKYSKFLSHQNYLLKKLNLQKLLPSEHDYEYISNENKSYSAFHPHHTKVNAAIFAPTETLRLLEISDDVILDLVKRHNQSHTSSTAYIKPGYIIITTDTQGNIRVFRQDSAVLVRKKIIAARKKWLKSRPTITGSQISLDATTDDQCMLDIDGDLLPEPQDPYSLKTTLDCKPRNIIKKSLLMPGRSLSPVQRSLKNKFQAKKKGDLSYPTNLESYSPYSGEYFSKPDTLPKTSSSQSTPIFTNHHVAVDFKDNNTIITTDDLSVKKTNLVRSLSPETSIHQGISDISFKGQKRGRKIDV